MSPVLELVWPSERYLASYVAALERFRKTAAYGGAGSLRFRVDLR